MIALLSGAKRNVGDHLITEHALKLLEIHRDEPVKWFANWESLDDKLDELSEVRTFVIAGGPGLRSNMYGGVYPLFSSPELFAELDAKLVFLGSGWKALMGDAWDIRHELFDATTKKALSTLADRVTFSTRDYLSQNMLKNNGLDSVMTGCPVWYEDSYLGAPPQLPSKLRRIVFTEPRRPEMRQQSLLLLKALQGAYPQAEIVASFHHGFDGIEDYVSTVRAMGVDARDVAADTSKIAFYDDFDLHVGYRVHAGLYFLSRRKPSLIVSEDARGRGSAEALGVPWVAARQYCHVGAVVRGSLPYGRVARMARRLGPLVEPRRDVSSEVLSILDHELRGRRWPSYRDIGKTIDSRYRVMQEFITSF